MTKISMLIYHKDYQHFLENLREQGVVHVHTKKKSLENETLKALLAEIRRVKTMVSQLAKQPESKQPQTVSETDAALLDRLEEQFKSIDNQRQRVISLQKDAAIYQPWGTFPEETLQKIRAANWDLRFFSTPARKYDPQWETEYNAFLINEIAGVKYFTVVLPKEQPLTIDAERYTFPTMTEAEIAAAIQAAEADIAERRQWLSDIAVDAVQKLEAYKLKIQETGDFFKVSDAAEPLAAEKLMYLEGWVPAEKEPTITEWLNGESVYYQTAKPNIDTDDPPIKLKNGFFAQLFEFLGEMYALPTYWELDLTPFFAPFYVMFFGLCLGDAGYGLLMLVAILSLLISRKLEKMKSILWFGFFIGLGTTIMGTISGSFFGMKLLDVDIPFVNALKGFMFKDDGWFTAFNFSLIIGAVQIIFGMILKVVNMTKVHGFGAAVSTLGWLFLLLGCGLSYYFAGVGILFYIALIVGGLMVFVFNSPIRKIWDPLVNVGSGMWDAYNFVTGLLGDILSYIRLFALGLSGSILGLVFNDLAMKMSGDIPVVSQIIMVVIFLFGHTLNFAISGLGAFVHPMRLTFVEFYKNAGFTGGGKKYEPFQKKELNH